MFWTKFVKGKLKENVYHNIDEDDERKLLQENLVWLNILLTKHK